ncbi:MAG: CRISPR-associated endonuclease Cas2 [Flavobacteriaceae bacterium]|nr:CRISPR-associated endonuclease Cas2 [Flavobacteriaceae bacterium]
MQHQQNYSNYKIMWILVSFDLPTNTKKERKIASRFRKNLIEDGFVMFQYSIYMRHCNSRENAEVHKRRVRSLLPEQGKVSVLAITDKQFGNMEIYHGIKEVDKPGGSKQLTLF